MLKNLFAIVIFTSLSLAASAQTATKTIPLPVVCFSLEELFKLIKEAGEKPVFLGDDEVTTSDAEKNVSFLLTFSEKTKEYSAFLIIKNIKVGCVLSSGSGKFVSGKAV